MAQVSIYSTPSCTYCKAAKEYFAENNIQFQEFNVAEDMARRQEMIERSGQMGVPVIMVDNNIVVGYNKPKLAELLGLAA
jgi:glutaredoxin 3